MEIEQLQRDMNRLSRVLRRLTFPHLVDRTEEEKSLKMNFWLPENTPEAKASVKMVWTPCSLSHSRPRRSFAQAAVTPSR